ncbi:hypothetical protein [Candidatus Frankia alpina]|uniref:hypothetical protein n=1 Tax=Candidatus Frankia alpina TaxID=2699483 RepID=UPI001A99CB10|nr:hypothetical protein [Candidatus Frankia alpina]
MPLRRSCTPSCSACLAGRPSPSTSATRTCPTTGSSSPATTTCRSRWPASRSSAATRPTAAATSSRRWSGSDVINDLNERFGLNLGTSDQILLYQQVACLVEDPRMQQVALMNDEARFGQVADGRLDDIVAENAAKNEDFMKPYFDNQDFQQAVKETARKRAYRIITDPARDEALARLRTEMLGETT